MIIEFSISNFGSIKEKQTLSFEATNDDTLSEYYIVEPIPGLKLLKLAMIYGANASGKTTVLQALECLKVLTINPTIDNSQKLSFNPFLLDEDFKTKPSVIDLAFVKEGKKYVYHVEFTENCILNESLDFFPKGREANFYKRKTDVKNQTVSVEYGSLVKISAKNRFIIEANTLWNNTVLGTLSKSNIDFPEMKIVHDWFRVTLMSLIYPVTRLTKWADSKIHSEPNSKEEVTNLLSIADVHIDKISVIEGLIEQNNKKRIDIKMLFQHSAIDVNGNTVKVDFEINQESSGTIRYYGLAAVLAEVIEKNKIFMIDEFETSLHPDLAKNFILRFLTKSENSQLLITTHNVSFMGNKDIIRRDTNWFTQKNKDGSTELYSAADFDSSVLRKESSLLNVYETGKLGGKPNLGSIFS